MKLSKQDIELFVQVQPKSITSYTLEEKLLYGKSNLLGTSFLSSGLIALQTMKIVSSVRFSLNQSLPISCIDKKYLVIYEG